MTSDPLPRLTKRRPTTDELMALLDELRDSHDRAAAIIVAALAEDALEQAIMTRLIPLSETHRKELFDGEAPLSSFSAKIKLAHAMAIIDKDTRYDLIKIKNIRNDFAHAKVPVTFGTAEIRNECATLNILSRLTASARKEFGIDDMSWPPTTAKMQYIAGARVLTWMLEGLLPLPPSPPAAEPAPLLDKPAPLSPQASPPED